MSVSLIPERPLLLFPSLAKHFGLEEALLLQVLSDSALHRHSMVLNNRQWLEIPNKDLLSILPFWNDQDISRLLTSLHHQNVLLLDNTNTPQDGILRFALNQPVSGSSPQLPTPTTTAISTPIANNPVDMTSSSEQASPQLHTPSSPAHSLPNATDQQPQALLSSTSNSIALTQAESPETPTETSIKTEKLNPHPVFQQPMNRSPSQQRQERSPQPITDQWRPSQEVLQQLTQIGVPLPFIKSQLPTFIVYWKDRQTAQHSWNSLFMKFIVREWRYEESRQNREKRQQNSEENPSFLNQAKPVLMDREWRPSDDAFEILERSGIHRSFLDDSIPEFILYWRERGEPRTTWNTKFVQHVRKQWAYYSAATQAERTPKLIPDDWTPSDDCYDIIRMANIDLTFAQNTVKEFVLYWKESKQAHSSWNAKFLHHVKFCWAKRHELANQVGGQASARHKNPYATESEQNQTLEERLSDHSWADGL